MKKYLWAVAIILLSGTSAWADAHMNFAKIACFPELNVLSIEQDVFWGQQATNFSKAHPEKMMKEYGFYDINAILETDYPGNITGYHPKEAECQLGEDKYHITLLPHTTLCRRIEEYFSLNEAPFRITITKNGRLLTDELLFAWGEKGTKIKKIYIINGGYNPLMNIDTYPEKYSKYYFFEEDNFVPVTTENFYDRKREIQDGHAVDEPAVPFCYDDLD